MNFPGPVSFSLGIWFIRVAKNVLPLSMLANEKNLLDRYWIGSGDLLQATAQKLPP
jgi:hypothetical protein